MAALNDVVAVVTGAGSGIGRAVAQRFVAEGARVIAVDLSPERLETLRKEAGSDLAAVAGDVTRWDDNQAAIAAAVARWGRLDCFVGNVGIHDGGRRLEDLSEKELQGGFDEIFRVNVLGYLLGARAALSELRKTRGNMIFTLSTSSFYTGGGGALYLASKHAALGLVRALAYELAPEVRVNGVAPAGTATNLRVAPSLQGGAEPPAGAASADRPRSTNLLQLALQPEDHTAAYVLLASAEARALTGAVIPTDAGRGVASARRAQTT